MIQKLSIILISLLMLNTAIAQNLTGVKICINPGHGGYDADDRNVVIAPFTSGDPNGFWESVSNLDKGLALRDMLEAAGATVIMTRVLNRTQDDLPLSQIVAMANQASVDFMLSIHSNAGSGVANNVLMLHVGVDANDATVYNTFNPGNPVHKKLSDDSRDISTEIAVNMYANKITTWSSGISIRGDKTFARTAMGWSDGYGVLRGLYVPGVISEVGMHDYIPETYRLMNMEYKWLEAWNFYKSFLNYYNGGQIQTGNIAGNVRDSRIELVSTYNKFPGNDRMLPINGAKLTLLETNEVYTTDNMQNGVYAFKNLAPGTYNVKAEKEGYHPQTKEIVVSKHQITYMNFALNRVRSTPPQVLSYTPNVAANDSVDASTSIVFNFNWDMDPATTTAAFSITPHVEGTFTFEDTNYRMRFTPNKPLDKQTVYTVRLDKSASHPDNLSMTEDISFQFITKNRNRLNLLYAYPYDGAQGVYTRPMIRLIFDGVLTTSNLQAGIKVFDKNNNELAKNARSVLNNRVDAPAGSHYFELTNALVAGDEYKLLIPGDISDNVNMRVVEPIEIRFKASAVTQTDKTIVDNFENMNFSFDDTKSVNTNNSSAAKNTSRKLFDTSSGLFRYNFLMSNAHAHYTLATPADGFNSNKVVGLHVYGDLSGNTLQLEFSAGTDVRYVNLCNINFFGWEFHESKLESLPTNTNYQLTAVRIVRNAGMLSATGELYLDNMLLYDTPISSTRDVYFANASIYPNPAKHFVQVNGINDSNMHLKLYSVNGAMQQQSKGNILLLNNVKAGTYVLIITSNNKTYAQPLIVVK